MLNELECFFEHKNTERWGKKADGRWSQEDEPKQEEIDKMIMLANELADIDLLNKSYRIREGILYCLADIFSFYDLQGKGLVDLNKLKPIAEQLEEDLQEYLGEIL